MKLSSSDLKTIRQAMPQNTKKEKENRKLMDLTATERDMLTELKTLLEPFEYVTNLLQANTVSISKLDFYWIIIIIGCHTLIYSNYN